MSISGRKHCPWHAVDQHRDIVAILVQCHHNAKAAKRLLRKLLKKQVIAPRVMITDRLPNSNLAGREIMPDVEHRQLRG